MRVLLGAGANVILSAVLGETALILAASARARESVPLLLEHHANPRVSDRDKKTVLMWVVDLQFHRGGVPVEVIGPLVSGAQNLNDMQEGISQPPILREVPQRPGVINCASYANGVRVANVHFGSLLMLAAMPGGFLLVTG
jgi:hypothetical protein